MSLLLRRTVSTPKCLFSLPRCTIDVQHASPFSTSTNHSLKTPQPRKPRTSKIPPSLTSSRMFKKQGASTSTWPRPTEIPFQGKAANSVNLFGKVEMPIQFYATPDGKHMSATFISQKNVAFNGKSSDSLSIPVVFEGDLAHTVACHVKQDDCVYVTGKLSFEELPFVLSENQGKFYVIGDELNFVQGLEGKEAKHVHMDVGHDNVVKEIVGNRKWVDKGSNEIEEKKFELLSTGKKRSSNDGGTTKDAVLDSWKDFLKNPMDWEDFRKKKSSGLLKANFPDFKNKTSGTPLWLSSAPKEVFPELEGLDVDAQVRIAKWQPAKGGKVKNEDSWKSLVKNPDKWWDCRLKKTSIKSPDFKHKDTAEALWLNNSPEWVLSQLPPSENEQHVSAGNKKAIEALDVGAAEVQVPKWRPGKGGKVKNEDSWKSLVENPDKWWDNRSGKTNIKAPDFKHKDTGEVLWLAGSPKWVLSQLPPLRNEQNVSAGNKKAIERLDVDAAQVQVPKLLPGKGRKVKNEESWKSLVESPDKWWDNRSRKTNSKAPDFKHKETGEALWLNSSPEWVLSQLPPPRNEQNVSGGSKKAFVAFRGITC